METPSLTPDAIICICLHLDARDIVNVGLSCWNLCIKVLNSQKLWYNWIVKHWDSNSLPVYLGLSIDDANWKLLALMGPSLRERELCKIHLRKRFEAPMSMKTSLRFYCEIRTDDGRVATIILVGKEIDYETFKDHNPKSKINSYGYMLFEYLPKEKDTSVLTWLGEGNIHSTTNFLRS